MIDDYFVSLQCTRFDLVKERTDGGRTNRIAIELPCVALRAVAR